jgi:hypothetical protein
VVVLCCPVVLFILRVVLDDGSLKMPCTGTMSSFSVDELSGLPCSTRLLARDSKAPGPGGGGRVFHASR